MSATGPSEPKRHSSRKRGSESGNTDSRWPVNCLPGHRYAATVDKLPYGLCQAAAKLILKQQPSKAEEGLQALMTVIHVFSLAFVNAQMVVRDTHKAAGPEGALPDHFFSMLHTSSAMHGTRTQWQHCALLEELKSDLGNETKRKSGLVQVHDRLCRVSAAQASAFPNAATFVQLSDGRQSEMFVKEGGRIRGVQSLLMLPGASEAGLRPRQSDGFRLYLSILNTKLAQRHFHVEPYVFTVPQTSEFAGAGGRLEMVLLRISWGKSVYQHERLPVVVKLFQEPTHLEREERAITAAATALKKLGAEAPVTRLVEAEVLKVARSLNPGSNLLLLTPVADGTLADVTCTAALFVSACWAGATVLNALHADGFVHGDISLTNMLVHSNRVLVNDFGSTAKVNTLCNAVPSTELFRSGRIRTSEPNKAYEALFDWEALFYVLVAFARRTSWALKRHRRVLPFERLNGERLANEKLGGLMQGSVLSLLDKDARDLKVTMSTIGEESDQYDELGSRLDVEGGFTSASGLAAGDVVVAAAAAATATTDTVAPGASVELGASAVAGGGDGTDTDVVMGSSETNDEEAARLVLTTALPILQALRKQLVQALQKQFDTRRDLAPRDFAAIHEILAKASVR